MVTKAILTSYLFLILTSAAAFSMLGLFTEANLPSPIGPVRITIAWEWSVGAMAVGALVGVVVAVGLASMVRGGVEKLRRAR